MLLPDLPLVALWGGGELTSADGLRFTVPVKTINAGPNPKYFGKGKGAKGVTYYNFTSNQFTGFHGIVIPGLYRSRAACTALVRRAKVSSSSRPTRSPVRLGKAG